MILILVILFELVIVITSYLYSTNLDFILKEEFNKTFLIEYKHGTDKSISVDFVQQNVRKPFYFFKYGKNDQVDISCFFFTGSLLWNLFLR